MHLLWFEVSLVAGTLLLTHASGAAELASRGVYAASVSGLFGVSALYHRGNWTARWHGRLQRLDQAMIPFLIAGTATPALLLGVPRTFGLIFLTVLWALTAAVTVIRMARLRAPEFVAGMTYIGLGLVAGLAIPEVWIRDGTAAGMLMLAGGGLYIAGALSYHRRSPDPRPEVFGYHEVFHAYVCAAAACQYVAIALFIK
jgi:hemolysin III